MGFVRIVSLLLDLAHILSIVIVSIWAPRVHVSISID